MAVSDTENLAPEFIGRILIVGAGPAGLTAAVELARHGIIPILIERRKTVSNLSRAVGILPHSMALLGPSGVADAIAAEAIPAVDVILYHHDKAFARIPLDGGSGTFDQLFALAQDRTEAHLIAAFERYGGEITRGANLTGLRAEENFVVATINGKDQEFEYVIGADGVGSTVRKAMDIPYDGFDLDETWSIADVEAKDWPDPSSFKSFLIGRGKAVIVVPLESTRYRVIANRPDALAALPVPMDVTHIYREGTFKISVRQARQYNVGRVFLVGDAAHCHSPVGGRGMNLGIADAADLAARFAKGGLEGYHAARHQEGVAVLRGSELGRKALMGSCAPCRVLVRSAICIASRIPMARRRIIRQILGLPAS